MSFTTEQIQAAKDRRAEKPALEPLPVTMTRRERAKVEEPATPVQVRAWHRRLTLAYHAEATAKTDEERDAARTEREHINHLLLEAAR